MERGGGLDCCKGRCGIFSVIKSFMIMIGLVYFVAGRRR